MDFRLRSLKKAATTGDVVAMQRYIRALEQSHGYYDVEMAYVVIEDLPVEPGYDCHWERTTEQCNSYIFETEKQAMNWILNRIRDFDLQEIADIPEVQNSLQQMHAIAEDEYPNLCDFLTAWNENEYIASEFNEYQPQYWVFSI